MTPLRVYVDSSVFGGCFDEEFEDESRRFFEQVKAGRILVLISQVVVDELADAPASVQQVLASLPPEAIETVGLTSEVIGLRDEYIRAGIVTPKFLDDATHVAAATAVRADAIVSWNFRHIVRIDKMRAYNAVNLREGYGLLSIVSPREVQTDEDE